jgi:hypothetical protein
MRNGRALEGTHTLSSYYNTKPRLHRDTAYYQTLVDQKMHRDPNKKGSGDRHGGPNCHRLMSEVVHENPARGPASTDLGC